MIVAINNNNNIAVININANNNPTIINKNETKQKRAGSGDEEKVAAPFGVWLAAAQLQLGPAA